MWKEDLDHLNAMEALDSLGNHHGHLDLDRRHLRLEATVASGVIRDSTLGGRYRAAKIENIKLVNCHRIICKIATNRDYNREEINVEECALIPSG